jgi:hypothetical protein
MHPLRSVLLLLLLALGPGAVAQSVTATAGAAVAGSVVVGVHLEDLRAGDTVVDLDLTLRDAFSVGLDLRSTETFGALGNVTFELGGALRTDGRYRGRAAVRGVLGPAALSAAISAFDADDRAFSLSAPEGGRPDLGAGRPGFGLEIGAAYRVSTAVVLELAPDLYLVDGALALRLATEVTLRRLLDEVDGVVLAHAYAEPGLTGGHAAVGVGAVWRRRRAPVWRGSVWLGAGPTLAPGVRIGLGERVGDGLLELNVAAEPYRLDLPPYRSEAAYTHPFGGGDLTLRAAVRWDGALTGEATLGYSTPLSR